VTHRPRRSSSPTAPARAGSSPSSVAASPSAPVSAGQSVLSAFAASGRIAAGSDAVIDGRLTRSGSGVPGVTVTLVERLAGQPGWHVAGTALTTAAGNVAVTVRALTENTVFGLTAPGVVPSGGVVVIVIPQIVSSLAVGPGGVLDNLVVSTQDADTGNLVVLEVQATNGSWRYLRSRELDASGQASFTLSGTRLSGREVRVVLLGTIRHGAAIASPVTVPPPS